MIGGKWMERAERAARERSAAMLDRLEAASGDVRRVRVERQPDALVLRGRGLLRRRLSDPLLRFWAKWAR